MKKIVTALIGIVLFSVPLVAQDYSANDFIQKGKQAVQAGYFNWDKAQLLKARGLFERAMNKDPQNEWVQYYLLYTDYRLITYFMQENDKEHLKQYLSTAEDEGQQLIKVHPDNAEAKALMCSVYGLKISTNWAVAPVIGPKSQKLIDEAMKLAPDNPRVLLQAGISKYNTPGFFGGDKDEAVDLFRQSIKQYTQDSSSTGIKPAWGYPDACAWLGIAYVKNGKYSEAITVYEKGLARNPDFGWIKYNLLPAAKKQLAAQATSQ